MKKTVAFIGSVGIPNRYGGFESFLENVCPEIVSSDIHVIVTCDSGQYFSHEKIWGNIERVFIPIKANGPTSPIHDLVAFFKVLFRSSAICALGVSAGPFFLLMRILCSMLGKQLVINVDGIEWRRTKFSWFGRLVLRVFDACAQLAAHTIIIDSPALAKYIFPGFQSKTRYVPYSGDHVKRLEKINDGSPAYALTICRIEPENNLEMLIDGMLASNLPKYIIIGNWEHSAFSRALRQKHAQNKRIETIDPIYDSNLIAEYRENCVAYLHGHSVGGTNPSLVEMLFYDCQILCFDCEFNRHTAGGMAGFFNSVMQLTHSIDEVIGGKNFRTQTPLLHYTKKRIAEQYVEFSLP
jgi:glycosyltransferase involved in cell wall biosynthesis